MSKATIIALLLAVIGAGALWMASRSGDSPREVFARKVVRTLAANNWDHSVMGTFLCDNQIIRDLYERQKTPLSFDLYRKYDGIKAIGKIKLEPPASFPQMAMDTFIPVLFNRRFVPYPTMPDHIAYHAAYIQLATQESSRGQWCLTGWGRNDIPVKPHQANDFLSYQGIYDDR